MKAQYWADKAPPQIAAGLVVAFCVSLSAGTQNGLRGGNFGILPRCLHIENHNKVQTRVKAKKINEIKFVC